MRREGGVALIIATILGTVGASAGTGAAGTGAADVVGSGRVAAGNSDIPPAEGPGPGAPAPESNADGVNGPAEGAGGGVPRPRDTPYPGTIGLRVDVTDLERHVLNVHEVIPATPGPLTLLYPGMAAWQPCAARTDRRARRAHHQRQWEAGGVDARPREHLRVQGAGARGGQSPRRRVSIRGAADGRRGPDQRHTRDRGSAVEHGGVISGGLLCDADHRGTGARAAGGVGVRLGARCGESARRERDIQTRLALHAGGFAGVRRALFPHHRVGSCARRVGSGEGAEERHLDRDGGGRAGRTTRHRGRHSGELRHQAGAARGSSQARAGDVCGLRGAALRSLRHVAGA